MPDCEIAVFKRKKLVPILWLMPAPPARDFLRATVERLARRHDAPIFEPHLTLGVSAEMPVLLQQIAAGPIRLRKVGTFFSSVFTKTLFVRFELTPALESLRLALGMNDVRYDPHLSLLYRKLPMEDKARLARSVSLPFATITFDRIAFVRCVSPTRHRADVESWQFLAAVKLRSTARKRARRAGKVTPEHKQTASAIRKKE